MGCRLSPFATCTPASSTGCSLAGPATSYGCPLLCSGGGGLVADVLASSVVRPKVAQLFVLDVPLFRATGILPFWVLDSGTVYVAEGGALVRFSASSALR